MLELTRPLWQCLCVEALRNWSWKPQRNSAGGFTMEKRTGGLELTQQILLFNEQFEVHRLMLPHLAQNARPRHVRVLDVGVVLPIWTHTRDNFCL